MGVALSGRERQRDRRREKPLLRTGDEQDSRTRGHSAADLLLMRVHVPFTRKRKRERESSGSGEGSRAEAPSDQATVTQGNLSPVARVTFFTCR